MSDASRWVGLTRLVADAVVHGSRAVEKVHLVTTARTFRVLEHVPVVSEPSRLVHLVHDACTMATYASIRAVTGAVRAAVEGGAHAWAEGDPARPENVPDAT